MMIYRYIILTIVCTIILPQYMVISDIHIDSFTLDQFKKNQIKQIVEFILSYEK